MLPVAGLASCRIDARLAAFAAERLGLERVFARHVNGLEATLDCVEERGPFAKQLNAICKEILFGEECAARSDRFAAWLLRQALGLEMGDTGKRLSPVESALTMAGKVLG